MSSVNPSTQDSHASAQIEHERWQHMSFFDEISDPAKNLVDAFVHPRLLVHLIFKLSENETSRYTCQKTH